MIRGWDIERFGNLHKYQVRNLPPGLIIGEITSLETSADGLFKSGEVQLDQRLGTLTEVTVLIPLNPEE